MPKYRVFLHETEIYGFDVAANDEQDAVKEADNLFRTTSRSAHQHDVTSGPVEPLPDDAEVENL